MIPKISVFEHVRARFGGQVRPEIREARLYQDQEALWIEIETDDGNIEVTDVCAGFNVSDSLDANERRFREFDLYSMIQVTNLLTPEAAQAIADAEETGVDL